MTGNSRKGASAAPNLTLHQLETLTRHLTKEGLLIEAGFASLRAAAMHPDAPPNQVQEMRMAFFAGAQHLFGSIMSMLDPGTEPTDDEMAHMEKISDELDEFIKDFEMWHIRTGGRA
jgi:hypothetical protein